MWSNILILVGIFVIAIVLHYINKPKEKLLSDDIQIKPIAEAPKIPINKRYKELLNLLKLEDCVLNTHPIALNFLDHFIFNGIDPYMKQKILFILITNGSIQIYLKEIDPLLKTDIVLFRFANLMHGYNSDSQTYVIDLVKKTFHSTGSHSKHATALSENFALMIALVYILIKRLRLYISIAGIFIKNGNIPMIDSFAGNNMYFADIVQIFQYISLKEKPECVFKTSAFKKEITVELVRFRNK